MISMEKTAFTIEIKQDVSYVFFWIVAGIIVVSAAFFSQDRVTELWPAINAGGIAGILYALAVMVFTMRSPVKTRIRLASFIGFAITFSFLCASWLTTHEQSRWQHDRILEIRTVIARGISSVVLRDPLLNTFAEYHAQSPLRKLTLEEVFKGRNPTIAEGLNLYKPQWAGDTLMRIYVHTLSNDSIVLIATDRGAAGRENSFINYNGTVGKIQERYTLTEKGLTRESEN